MTYLSVTGPGMGLDAESPSRESMKRRPGPGWTATWSGGSPATVRIAGAIRMLRQLLVSTAVSACNIAIHAIVMAAVLWAARRE